MEKKEAHLENKSQLKRVCECAPLKEVTNISRICLKTLWTISWNKETYSQPLLVTQINCAIKIITLGIEQQTQEWTVKQRKCCILEWGKYQ